MRKVLFALFLFSLAAAPSRASVPNQFSVQGVLRDGAGKLQSTMVNVTASLFAKKIDGTALAGPYGPMAVMATNGLFTVPFTDPAIQTKLAGAAELWLQVTVGNDTFERQLVTPQIYSLMCGTADAVRGLTVLQDGKVGIGTESPNGKLDVNGFGRTVSKAHNVRSVAELGGGDSSNNAIIFNTGAPANATALRGLYIGAANQDFAISRFDSAGTGIPIHDFLVKSNGNVGIGTGSPSALLTIKPASDVAQLRLEQQNSTDAWTMFASNAGGFFQIARVGTGENTPLTILQNGNVGIGTPNPKATLDVAGAIRTSYSGSQVLTLVPNGLNTITHNLNIPAGEQHVIPINADFASNNFTIAGIKASGPNSFSFHVTGGAAGAARVSWIIFTVPAR